MSAPVEVVVLDLDDTIYPQADWLAGACDLVADAAAAAGAPREVMRDALDRALELGSDTGDTIGLALRSAGLQHLELARLVEVFRSHRPERLDPYPGAREAVALLAERVPLGLVTDGDPPGQRGKLDAVGLGSCFSAVVYTDELGRDHRKPDPAGLLACLEALGVAPDRAVMIGDRPDKDVACALAAGARAVRVRTGEHRLRPDIPGTALSTATLAEAARVVIGWTPAGHRFGTSAAGGGC